MHKNKKLVYLSRDLKLLKNDVLLDTVSFKILKGAATPFKVTTASVNLRLLESKIDLS